MIRTHGIFLLEDLLRAPLAAKGVSAFALAATLLPVVSGVRSAVVLVAAVRPPCPH